MARRQGELHLPLIDLSGSVQRGFGATVQTSLFIDGKRVTVDEEIDLLHEDQNHVVDAQDAYFHADEPETTEDPGTVGDAMDTGDICSGQIKLQEALPVSELKPRSNSSAVE